MNQPQSEYDSIAEAYKNSKQLSFRKYVEEYTLFAILGEIQGATVLDLACGEGFYTRKIKQAGAAEITGVDISAEMIQLAQKEERLRPVGCHYLHQNVAELALSASVDLVVAMYLLNYAQSKEELLRFVQVLTDLWYEVVLKVEDLQVSAPPVQVFNSARDMGE